MATTRNTRVNPLNGSVNWTEVLDEAHTIELHTDNGLYGFWLIEVPQSGSIVVYNTGTGVESGEIMEIITSGTPQANQVYPDVRNSSCFCWCNAADNGATVLVDYNGGGYGLHEEALHEQIEEIIEESLGGTGGVLVTEAELTANNQEVVWIKDVKAANTAGGGATSGSWETRTLNTLENPYSVTWVSLASNQFTLSSGEYEIYATAPAGAVNAHKAKIRNISDSSDEIIGSSEYTAVAAATRTISVISGYISIASSKIFELQHRVNTTKATDGYGVQSNFGVDEVYSQIMIRRIS